MLGIITVLDLDLKLHVIFQRTSYGRFSVKHKGPVTWNNLLMQLREVISLYTFKQELRWFIQYQHYPS